MKNVKNIINDLLQPSTLKDGWKINLIKNWPTIIGSLHDKISVQKIHATSVVIGVYDSCWMQELYMLSKLILKKINENLDRPRIETLRFICIEQKSQNHQSILKKTPEPFFKKKPMILTYQQKAALSKIDDTQLSQALEKLLEKCQSNS